MYILFNSERSLLVRMVWWRGSTWQGPCIPLCLQCKYATRARPKVYQGIPGRNIYHTDGLEVPTYVIWGVGGGSGSDSGESGSSSSCSSTCGTGTLCSCGLSIQQFLDAVSLGMRHQHLRIIDKRSFLELAQVDQRYEKPLELKV